MSSLSFTKEELIEILEYCNAWQGLGMSDFRMNAWLKIQSMIDNYCAHEWHNHCPECNPLNIYCKKCRCYLKDTHKI